MDVRPHMSQHERAEELPLVTDEATVTRVEAQDRNRKGEIAAALLDVLEIYDREAWIDEVTTGDGDGVDWERLSTLVEGADLRRPLRERIDALSERFGRTHPSLVSVDVDAPESFDYVPGQYATVKYDGTPRPYSIASSPNDATTEICVRRVPGGKLSERLCTELSPGDEVTLRGPNGDFVLQEPSHRDVAFLATGTGIAPLKSMIEYVFEEDWDVVDGAARDVWVFLGAGWEDDLAYRDRFRELHAEYDHFHFVPTLTREPFVTDWDGETDYVQRTLMKYVDPVAIEGADLKPKLRRVAAEDPETDVDARIDPKNLEVYACGINAMVYALVDAVEALGVDPNYVESEGYG